VAAAVLLLLLPACTGSTGAQDGSPSSGLSSSRLTPTEPTPDPAPPCTLLVGPKVLGLTERQAIRATAVAARATRSGASPIQVARALPAARSGVPVPRLAAARALLGYDGPALTCYFLRADLDDQRIRRSGLTRRAERLRDHILDTFGSISMGGFASGGVSTGHVDNSAHYEGRAIDLFLRPHTDRGQARRGWALSQWLVARAQRLQVLSVIYRDHIWTVWASYVGWRDYVHPSGNTTNPVLRHLDHVHTAVLGGPYIRERG
jgi:hypothetical protein